MNSIKNNPHFNNYQIDLHISNQFEKIVDTIPNDIALIYEDQHLSYEMLNKKSNQLARQIRKEYLLKTGQELTPDTMIALYLDRSLEMIISILAVLKAGAAYVPIDLSYPQQRVDHILTDTRAEIILCQQNDKQIEFPAGKIMFVDLQEKFYLSEDASNLLKHSQPHDLAYVIYTSGSSGKPKGVMVEHQQVVSFSKGNNFIDYEKVQMVAGISNYAFDGSVFDIFLPLLNGKQLVLFDRHCLFDLELFSSQFIRYNIDTVFLTTALFNSAVINNLECLKVLKQLLFGGEAVNITIVNTFKSLFKETDLIHVYGPTETIVYTSYCNLTDYNTTSIVPIGTALADKELYVLNDMLEPVAYGEIGELYIGGAGLARGYMNNEYLTKEKFIELSLVCGESDAVASVRLYKTGDLVKRLPDENLEFIGRNDEQVKIRGFRIELSEIEQTLQQIPGIKDCKVLVKERCTDSGLHKNIVAYYILDQNNTAGNDNMVLDSWEDLYDSSVYDKTSGEVEMGSDFSGWNSYITGQPIPLPEMEAWRENILSIILRLNPINVLEIGVGSGLFMYPLLKKVKTFTGIDLSNAVIKRHLEFLKDTNDFIRLYHLKAHEIDQLPDNKTYDTIIINSVAQHFPNIDYFEEVLQKSLDQLSSNGSLFIGDISNYDVHKEMIREKLTYNKVTYVEEDLRKLLLKETHLLISPRYFNSVQEKYKNIKIKVLKRETTYTNELSKYRYDVVITKEKEAVIRKPMSHYIAKHNTDLYNIPFLNQLTKDGIIQQLSKELPEYMIPNSYIVLESFPLTANGKLDKIQLPEPDLNHSDEYIPPTTDMEKSICRIWQEVLGVNNIGISDDFFKLGGNSILAIRTSHRMSHALRIELKAADIFKYRTVSQLLSNKSNHSRDIISRYPYNQAPLSLTQEGLWLVEEFEGGTNAYHVPAVYELTADTDPEGIKYALRQIVARHEILRSTIQGDTKRAFQTVHQEPLMIKEIMLSSKKEMRSILMEDINKPFNLRKEYPLRATLYKVPSSGSEQYTTILLINMHHIVTDGWSVQIFYKELFAYYNAYKENNTNFSFPELDIQYKDYAIWQRQQLTGEKLDDHVNYWRERLSGYQVLAFPTDFPRPNRKDYTGSSEPFTLTKEISNRIRDLARKYGTTVHSIMLASVNILLSKYTGQDDIVLGGHISNRQHSQTQDLIGFFVNLQVNRTKLRKGQSYEELIQEVHQQQIKVQDYQNLPFERLVEELEIDLDFSKPIIFQIVFVVQNFDICAPEEYNSFLPPFKEIPPYEKEEFDITILVNDNKEEISGKFRFATALFKVQTIVTLIENYMKLIDILTLNPQRIYDEISLAKLK
ncbi:non-ribosomal peptide synthetase [Chryseobacterium indologenes]|uniref:non-ribosomal peptide synthetase n=1 Tax=Chryseobacterium indologenes TaxID=253 RepID=UPI0003E067B6|nr:non-ribosomal peptide synthetase [Chryseobacterium indologenes]QPQ51847.1 non-ribosomal peptide synthetase [Chryseobacterium indologenes]GAE64269.1 putative non-ribosomal peptide synthetase [Chryseobacterium indologenes NBRC 14944]SFI68172.1 amino acid adenylation domain-containing protein [Chryseobacterium indologenes]SUX50395.1 Chondramide synthase cmdD [Chryseobacterium indologenes]